MTDIQLYYYEIKTALRKCRETEYSKETVEHAAGLIAVGFGDVAHLLHGIDNFCGSSVADAEIALKQGADMIELDVTKSADGILYVFHIDYAVWLRSKICDLKTVFFEHLDCVKYSVMFKNCCDNVVFAFFLEVGCY